MVSFKKWNMKTSHTCFNCGKYGHNNGTCPDRIIEDENTNKSENASGENNFKKIGIKDASSKAESLDLGW